MDSNFPEKCHTHYIILQSNIKINTIILWRAFLPPSFVLLQKALYRSNSSQLHVEAQLLQTKTTHTCTQATPPPPPHPPTHSIQSQNNQHTLWDELTWASSCKFTVIVIKKKKTESRTQKRPYTLQTTGCWYRKDHALFQWRRRWYKKDDAFFNKESTDAEKTKHSSTKRVLIFASWVTVCQIHEALYQRNLLIRNHAHLRQVNCQPNGWSLLRGFAVKRYKTR